METDKEETNTIDGSNMHTIIHKSSLRKLQDKADKYDKLIKSISNPQYQESDLGDSFIGCAASLVPQCKYNGVSTIIPFIAASLFANTNIPLPPTNNLVSSQPS
eukprot:3222033-Ditylum_brightwellii.AAC.1